VGTLLVMRYATKLFAKAADHTYVECIGGKTWSCWGGRTGGVELRRGTGSTRRADAIAEPNERSGIKCYLINGVCHQAANRMLLPAGITVNGARGYPLSQALFGPYGRVWHWPCHAPFHQHPDVTGEIPPCVASATIAAPEEPLSPVDQLDWNYIRGALGIYERYSRLVDGAQPGLEAANVPPEVGPHVEFQMELFAYMLDFHVGSLLEGQQTERVLGVRREFEDQRIALEERFAQGAIPESEFVTEFDRLTLEFQAAMANAMTDAQYETLFQLRKDERIVLTDPEIVGGNLDA
jgi:hypothetical protein